MKIIVCIDDKNGMNVQSPETIEDREVRRDMLSYIGHHRLWMNEYSRKQFEAVPKDAQIEVNENFPAFAGDDVDFKHHIAGRHIAIFIRSQFLM